MRRKPNINADYCSNNLIFSSQSPWETVHFIGKTKKEFLASSHALSKTLLRRRRRPIFQRLRLFLPPRPRFVHQWSGSAKKSLFHLMSLKQCRCGDSLIKLVFLPPTTTIPRPAKQQNLVSPPPSSSYFWLLPLSPVAVTPTSLGKRERKEETVCLLVV